MNDAEIRRNIKIKYKNNIFVDEVNVGRARVDLIDLTNELHGIEIKGDGDNYSRISNQVKNYNKHLSRITIYVGENKRNSINLKVPKFWGIVVVYRDQNGIVQFEEIRESSINPNFDKRVAICTLWKSELLDIITSKFEVSSRSRYVKMRRWRLASILERELDANETIKLIRISYLKRIKDGGWRD